MDDTDHTSEIDLGYQHDIRQFLSDIGEPRSAPAIALQTGIPEATVRQVLPGLIAEGAVTPVSYSTAGGGMAAMIAVESLYTAA